MLKNLLFVGLGVYFYMDMKKKYELMLADREALLNFLTPEQKAALIQGMTKAQEAIKTVGQS